MSVELARCLLASGAVNEADLSAALLLYVNAKMPFAKALLHLRVLSEDALERELARAEVPHLRTIVPVPASIRRPRRRDVPASSQRTRPQRCANRHRRRGSGRSVRSAHPRGISLFTSGVRCGSCAGPSPRSKRLSIASSAANFRRASSCGDRRGRPRRPRRPLPPLPRWYRRRQERADGTPFGVPVPHGDPTEQIRPSDRPIPLVRGRGAVLPACSR